MNSSGPGNNSSGVEVTSISPNGVAERLLKLSLAKTDGKRLTGDANDAIGYDEFGLPK